MILCCGEALIDMLPGKGGFTPVAGGAVFNTAIALGRLGFSAGLFSGLSSDFFGDMLRHALQQSGVNSQLAILADRPTTLAFVQLVDGQARYAFYDENTAGRMLHPCDLPPLDDNIKALFFGGISLMAEPCGSTYEALMQREADRVVTMIDPNIRPAFIADAQTYRMRLERMMAQADIVKLSDEDMQWLSPAKTPAQQARELIAKGTKLVLVTQGAEGASAYTAQHHVFVPARPAQVADTVGAGDTFNAAIMASLSAQGLLDKQALQGINDTALCCALTYGNRAAAITVARNGANPPWKQELD